MNYGMVFNTTGKVVKIEAIMLAVPAIVALIFAEWWYAAAFAISAAIALAVGFALTLLRPRNQLIFAKEGLVTVALAWIFVKIKFFSLPNVLADEMIQPELLQGEVNPARILSEAEKFWKTPTHRASVIEKLHAACAKLGEPGATDRAAAIIIKAAET